jgi:prophage regulatory protein
MTTRILRLPEVTARTGLGRSTLYARIQAGEFPPPVSLGARAVGWPEADVAAWIDARIAASRTASSNGERG